VKFVIYGLLVLAYLYLCTWIFNHGQAWIGIGLAVVGILFAVYKAEKLIKNQSATTKE
jgi:hypothetical protein